MKYIRRAEESDIPRILELLVQVDMVHHNGRPDLFKGPATKYNAQELRKIFADQTTPVFVCTNDEGMIMGHAFCIHQQIPDHPVMSDVKTLYIDDICVDEAFRGHGVGRSLYRHIMDYARLHEIYNITLNVWACNQDALSFYEAMGFKLQKMGMEIVLGSES